MTSTAWAGVAVASPRASVVPAKIIASVGMFSLLAATTSGVHLQQFDFVSKSTGFAVYQPTHGPAKTEREQSTADLIRDIHAKSGLTWDQIAKIFGVSRRSVHLWSNGGRLTAANHELLSSLHAEVRRLSLTGSAEFVRSALLRSEGGNPSTFDAFRAMHAGSPGAINRASDGGGTRT